MSEAEADAKILAAVKEAFRLDRSGIPWTADEDGTVIDYGGEVVTNGLGRSEAELVVHAVNHMVDFAAELRHAWELLRRCRDEIAGMNAGLEEPQLIRDIDAAIPKGAETP